LRSETKWRLVTLDGVKGIKKHINTYFVGRVCVPLVWFHVPETDCGKPVKSGYLQSAEPDYPHDPN